MSSSYPGPEPGRPAPHDSAYPGPPPYGPTPYGPPGGPGHYDAPDIRPTTVTIAGWVTIALSALSILAGIGGIAGGSALVDFARTHPAELELSPSEMQNLDSLRIGLVVLSVALIIAAVIAIVVAVLVLRRHGWARIVLVVLSALTVILGLVASINLIGLPWLVGSIAVIVLLFVGGSNEWFSRSSGSAPGAPGYPSPYDQPPYGQPPPGQSPGPYQQGPYPGP